ncbi:MAG: YbaN family protein [Paludibacteraceae bacterium]|nr:YbaN family protein [Paludibacteraceae bacterium]MBO7233372.1 YbaN family protein [Paludibacteraceae bacterium]
MHTALILIAFISLTLGLIGIFLPILPTTPFLLLSAWLFAHSSPRLHHWLLNHPTLGSYIRNFQEEKALPLRIKIISISTLWITLLISICILHNKLWLQILLTTIGVAVTWHILSFKTKKATPESNQTPHNK